MAEGGFAIVYLATDANEQEYAVKVMNGSTPEIVKEIEREVKILRAFKHPNIMPALGFSKQSQEYVKIIQSFGHSINHSIIRSFNNY